MRGGDSKKSLRERRPCCPVSTLPGPGWTGESPRMNDTLRGQRSLRLKAASANGMAPGGPPGALRAQESPFLVVWAWGLLVARQA